MANNDSNCPFESWMNSTDYSIEAHEIPMMREAWVAAMSYRDKEDESRGDRLACELEERIRKSVAENLAEPSTAKFGGPETVASKTGVKRQGHDDEDKANGQHEGYWVLSAEELSKGYVRPYRTSYKHVGENPSYPLRDLTEDEAKRYAGCNYVSFEKYPEEGSIVGSYWTQKRLDSGCGAVTRMSATIAATYARKPDFYGATFCVGCGAHHPIAEFVWDGSEERVGS